jgi:hypothetical protein
MAARVQRSFSGPTKDILEFELELLAAIPACIGKVDKAAADNTMIFTILPVGDLDLPMAATFQLTIPPSWPGSPPTVTFVQGKPPRGITSTGQPVKINILNEDCWSRKYTLVVVFFSLRMLYRPADSLDTPWDSSHTPWLSASSMTGPPSGKSFGFIAAHSGSIGRRKTMEDVVLLRQGIIVPRRPEATSFFGIFDGHAGDACAKFAESEVPRAVLANLERGCGWRQSLAEGFLAVDARFAADAALSGTGAGCTACMVAFDGRDKLYAANLGDCRALVIIRGCCCCCCFSFFA